MRRSTGVWPLLVSSSSTLQGPPIGISALPLVFARRLASKRHTFIEDDDDVFRFRNPEASNVRRTHAGVPLGSSQVERDERKLAQQQLVEEDKMTDWRTFYIVATVVTILYTFLQWMVDSGPPFEPTVYEPYVAREDKSTGH